MKSNTVNQLFLATTLFRKLSEIYWFEATYSHDQDVDFFIQKIRYSFDDWFTERNFCNDEVLANFANL